MPKLGMEPIRRAEVINATLTCISVYGIDGMTLEKVAEYADCSKGVIAYYFKNKDNLTIEAFKAFLAFYGLKIGSELANTMTPGEMMDVTLKHILPPYCDDAEKKINVSQLDGIDQMYIPYQDQARLFVQFFSRAVLDCNLQEVYFVKHDSPKKSCIFPHHHHGEFSSSFLHKRVLHPVTFALENE